MYMWSRATKDLGKERILFSNVVVIQRRNLFWGRPWRSLDIKLAFGILGFHILTLFAPYTFTWDVFWLTLLSYFLTGALGITVGYHRLLAHRSFKIPKWLEYTCVYFGVHAAQVWFYEPFI